MTTSRPKNNEVKGRRAKSDSLTQDKIKYNKIIENKIKRTRKKKQGVKENQGAKGEWANQKVCTQTNWGSKRRWKTK